MRNLDMTMYWLLFNLDLGRLYQLPADGKTLIDHGSELGWRARRDRKTERSELLLHGVDFEHVHHRVIEPREKRRRGWRRSEKSDPGRHFKTWDRLANGGDVPTSPYNDPSPRRPRS